MTTARVVYPRLGEEVVLQMTPDTIVTPLDMVKVSYRSNDGWTHGQNEKWQAKGRIITDPCEIRAVLVKVGYCQDLNDVIAKIGGVDNVLPGQLREAFKKQLPVPDRPGPIGIPDASWVDPVGRVYFPCVNSDGCSDFRWSGSCFGGRWRWLVRVK